MLEIKVQFEEIISKAKKIAIVSHLRPDPDALFSSLALYRYLKVHKKLNVDVVLEATQREDQKEIIHYDEVVWTESLIENLDNYDTVIFLDGSETTRFSRFDLKDKLKDKTTVVLDHHPNDPDYEYSLYYCDTKWAGTAHLVGELIVDENTLLQDKNLAELVMWGILGDTGSFYFVDRHWSDVLTFSKKLIDQYNFSVESLNMQISTYSKHDINVVRILLENSVYYELKSGQKLMYTYMDDSYRMANKLSFDEVKSGIGTFQYNYLRKVKDHKWGFVVSVSPDSYSLSFRSSRGGANVKLIAEKYNGGGHIPAAGGKLPLDFAPTAKEAAEKMIKEIDEMELVIIEE